MVRMNPIKKSRYLIIILGAVIFSTAPFWHVAFKDNTVKNLLKKYDVILREAKVDGLNHVKAIEESQKDPSSSSLQQKSFETVGTYKKSVSKARAFYAKLSKVKKESEFLFFKNKEQFVNYLGIAVFLFYAAFSMFSFYYNRRSENKDYLQAVKIKSILILGGATFYAAYILYPSGGDFDGGVYWYISCMTALVAIAFSFTFIKYVADLEGQVLGLKGNLGRAFQYITTLKQKLLPIAGQAIETARSEQEKATIVDTLYDLEDKDKDFYDQVGKDCRTWIELFGRVSIEEHLDKNLDRKDKIIDALCATMSKKKMNKE